MAIDYVKVEEIINKQKSPYSAKDKLERVLGNEAKVGQALWKMDREGKVDLSESEHWWGPLGEAPKSAFDAGDFISLLERVGKQPDMAGIEEQWGSELDGWDFYLDRILEKVKDRADPLVKRWNKLPEPLRTGAGFAMAKLGLLKGKDLPAGALEKVCAMVVGSTSSRQENEVLAKIWSQPALGKALCKAGSADGVEIWSLDFLEHCEKQVTPEQIARIAGNVYYESEVPAGVALLERHADEVEPHVRKLARAKGKLAEKGSVVLGIFLARRAAKRGQETDADAEKLLGDAVNHLSDSFIAELCEALRAVPEKRREKLLLPRFKKPHGQDWPLLEACQTPGLLRQAVDVVSKWKRGEPWGKKQALEAFGKLGPAATKVLSQALTKSPPQRDVLATGLAATGDASAVPRLMELLADGMASVREIAIQGLVKVGEPATAALLEGLKQRKKEVRLGSAMALAMLKLDAAARAEVEAAAKKEKAAEVKKVLSAMLKKPGDAPAAGDATGRIETIRAKLSKTAKKAIDGAVADVTWQEGNVEKWRSLAKKHGDEFLVAAADKLKSYYLDTAQLERTWLPFLAELGAKSPVAIHLTAEIICHAHPADEDERDAPSHGELLSRLHEQLGDGLLEPLRQRMLKNRHVFDWYMESGLPGAVDYCVECLGHREKHARDWAEGGLVRLGDQALGAVYPLLEASKAQLRETAVSILGEILGQSRDARVMAEAQKALEKAQKREKSAKVKEAITALLFTLQQAGQTPIAELKADKKTHKELDARLTEQRSRLPKSLDAKKLPDLNWSSGAKLSTGARDWVLARLARESSKSFDLDLAALVKNHLEPECKRKLHEALTRQFPEKTKEGRLGWVLFSAGLLADDTAMTDWGRNLDDEARFGSSTEAFYRLDVLRRHGSSVALTWIDHWSRRARSRGLKSRAIEALDVLGKEMGLSRDEIGEKVMSSFDFDARHTRVWPYGDRTFTLRLTPGNQIQVEAEDGKAVKSLPAPRKGDDAEALKRSKAEFSALKKQVKQSTSAAVERLNQAMITSRQWRGTQWKETYLTNPLLSNLARHLLWGLFDEKNSVQSGGAGGGSIQMTRMLRLDESLDLADADDTTYKLQDDDRIGLAHPLWMDAKQIKRWQKLFGEYELVPPFEQLARPIHAPTREEKKGTEIDRFEEVEINPLSLRGHLERGQWLRGEPQDGGAVMWYLKPFGRADVTAVLDFEPGYCIGYADESEPQRITSIAFVEGLHEYRPGYRIKGVKLSQVDPVVFSEVVLDLTRLVERARETD